MYMLKFPFILTPNFCFYNAPRILLIRSDKTHGHRNDRQEEEVYTQRLQEIGERAYPVGPQGEAPGSF